MSEDDEIIVDDLKLRNAAGHIDDAIRNMKKALADADETAGPLKASWNGPAREAYELRQKRWTEAANDLTIMLTDVKNAVTETADRFKRTETGNVDLF